MAPLYFSYLTLIALACTAIAQAEYTPKCRPVKGSQDWPCATDWQALNSSVSGRLLQPPPPAAVCHADQPNFNNATCAEVTKLWTNASFHAADPVSVDSINFSNDSCLIDPAAPCSGDGYPVYVVNASLPEHVKAGIDFAKEKKVRLIVKGSGHDYLGRSIAPNSLSIWTHYMTGIDLRPSFVPLDCPNASATPAVKVAAGTPMKDIYEICASRNLTVVGGTTNDITLGGYVTGGGHSPLSTYYGLAVDQVLEVEIVTPSGDILTANECQNSDLFWAVRGGGGATFGVILSFTIKTFPIMPVSTYFVQIAAPAGSDAYWNTIAYLVSQYPQLSDNGLAGYSYIAPDPSALIPGSPKNLSGFAASFFTIDVSTGADAIFAPIEKHINETLPGQVLLTGNRTDYPDLYTWYLATRNTFPVGGNSQTGSRLLDRPTSSKPLADIRKAIENSIQPGGVANLNLVAGKGVHNAKIAGGGNAMHPSWRTAYTEYVTSANWTPLNTTQKNEALHNLTTKYVAALEELAPGAGSYLNEGDVNEQKYQETFWGTNYPRLLEIKRTVDPNDVFWCHPCVGDERWTVKGDTICRV